MNEKAARAQMSTRVDGWISRVSQRILAGDTSRMARGQYIAVYSKQAHPEEQAIVILDAAEYERLRKVSEWAAKLRNGVGQIISSPMLDELEAIITKGDLGNGREDE